LIEAGGLSLMCDPVLSYTYDTELFRYTYRDLPDQIDYVLITHCHTDHILFETMLQLRHKIKNIIVPKGGGGALQDPSLKLILENIGFKNVYELAELGSIETDRISLLGVPFLGEHCDLNVRTKLAYLVKVGRHSFLIAADSCNIEPRMYDYVHDQIGDVDAIFLGMECDGAPLSWMYGPLFTKRLERQIDESRRLAGSDFEQAIRIVDRFKCREVYVYAMGQEPWLNYVMSLKYTEQSRPIVESNKLINECRRRGIYAERLFGEKEILLD
jgi:L-ascorbate metabolism protein UlaG (beta-lactamase superfamily)